MKAKGDERQVSADGDRVCDLVFKNEPASHLPAGSHLNQSLEPSGQQKAVGAWGQRDDIGNGRKDLGSPQPMVSAKYENARLAIRDVDLVLCQGYVVGPPWSVVARRFFDTVTFPVLQAG